jgi:site-specific DNA-methyltransferase (adenine-specific)/adenine-specific DNA-methyltransferase
MDKGENKEQGGRARRSAAVAFERGGNLLVEGDCLDALADLPTDCLDLIYIDPPFFTGKTRSAGGGRGAGAASYRDSWPLGMDEYLDMLRPRLALARRLLSPTGSIFAHLDWHASHYVKCAMDEIFGADNFRNEIIWSYESGGRATKSFARKHDAILWHTKTSEWKFNPEASATPRNVCRMCGAPDANRNHMKKSVGPDGRMVRSIRSAGKIYTYPDDAPVPASDVWVDIPHLHQKDPERVGYPTQKPEALVARVIATASGEGDAVADFFCGSGSTCAAAARLGRRWIGCDISASAIEIASKRLRALRDTGVTSAAFSLVRANDRKQE